MLCVSEMIRMRVGTMTLRDWKRGLQRVWYAVLNARRNALYRIFICGMSVKQKSDEMKKTQAVPIAGSGLQLCNRAVFED